VAGRAGHGSSRGKPRGFRRFEPALSSWWTSSGSPGHGPASGAQPSSTPSVGRLMRRGWAMGKRQAGSRRSGALSGANSIPVTGRSARQVDSRGSGRPAASRNLSGSTVDSAVTHGKLPQYSNPWSAPRGKPRNTCSARAQGVQRIPRRTLPLQCAVAGPERRADPLSRCRPVARVTTSSGKVVHGSVR